MWKRIEGVAVAIAVLAIVAGIGLQFYHSDFPREPNPVTGRVVPENFHGTWVYLTRQEARLESTCLWIAGVAAVIAVAVDAYKDPWHRRDRLGR